MILLTATTDKIQVITSAATTIDVHASFMDVSNAVPPVVQGNTSGRLNAAITTATTTDVVDAPAASTIRNVKCLNIRNKHATTASDITVQFNQNGTLFELYKVTLSAGQTLEFVEGVGFFVVATTTGIDVKLRVTADSVHATAASFADITGLTYPIESGKNYCFEAHLFHVSNATTTGAQFAVNGPAATSFLGGNISTVTSSVSAAVFSSGAVATINTAFTAQTTGSLTTIVPTILSGFYRPSAAGTFAVRATSEVTVAAGLTVKAGSWLRLWETAN